MNNQQIAKTIYEKHCPDVVKELVGEERMTKRLEPLIENMMNGYDSVKEKVLQCYKTTYIDEYSDNMITNHEYFTFVGFSATNFVKKCEKYLNYDSPDKNPYHKYMFWGPAKRSNSRFYSYDPSGKVSDSDVTTFLYNDMKDYVYDIYRCLHLDDVFCKLGYENRYDDDDNDDEISEIMIIVLRQYAKKVLQLYEPGGEKYLESQQKVENISS